jgi:hypothetical protein
MLAACTVNRGAVAFRPIPSGFVATPGVEIIAEDGSFRLTAGQPFTPPFNQGSGCVLEPDAGNYAQGLATGARPVIVKLADDRQLYGLLSLCGAPRDARGPATRSYELEVPDSYVAATAGGRVSVYFETFTNTKLGAKAWILWLSETSFAREEPAGGAFTAQTKIDRTLGVAQGLLTVSKWTALGSAVAVLVGAVFLSSGDDATSIIGGSLFLALGGTGLVIISPIFAIQGKTTESKALGALAFGDGDGGTGREEPAVAYGLALSWTF